jgi:hypothetical protein
VYDEEVVEFDRIECDEHGAIVRAHVKLPDGWEWLDVNGLEAHGYDRAAVAAKALLERTKARFA